MPRMESTQKQPLGENSKTTLGMRCYTLLIRTMCATSLDRPVRESGLAGRNPWPVRMATFHPKLILTGRCFRPKAVTDFDPKRTFGIFTQRSLSVGRRLLKPTVCATKSKSSTDGVSPPFGPFRDSSADPDGRHLLPSGSGRNNARVSDEETIMAQSGTTVPPQPEVPTAELSHIGPSSAKSAGSETQGFSLAIQPASVYSAVQLPRLGRTARGPEAAHRAVRWPERELVNDGTQGVQLALMQKLANIGQPITTGGGAKRG